MNRTLTTAAKKPVIRATNGIAAVCRVPGTVVICQDVIIEPMNRHQWAPRPLCLRAFVVHNGTTKTRSYESMKSMQPGIVIRM